MASMFITSAFGPDRRISWFEVWIYLTKLFSEVVLSFLSRQRKLAKWGVIIFWQKSRQTSILTPAQTLPETLLFVLSWIETVVSSNNRIDCKCESVQICVRLVLDSKMTPVQTAHQTLGSCGLTSVTVFSRIPLWIVALMDMRTIWRNCG